MSKILVVLTGGTIGSKKEQGTISANSQSAYALLALYEEKYGQSVEFEVIEPFTILSENFRPKYWEILYKTVDYIKLEKYEGVIITHGTDTLSYTSSLLGYLFGHTPVPVVLTGANYPLEDRQSDGLVNFRSCVAFIVDKQVKGVFTIFQSKRKEVLVYLATRIMESDPYLDQYGCFGGVPFGKIVEEQFSYNISCQNPSMEEANQDKERVLRNQIGFHNEIILIRAYPGINYNILSFTKKTKAVLHYLYHSATGCIEGEGYSVLEFIKRCKKENVDVYVASIKSEKKERYVTANKIIEAGAIPLLNISLEAAYMKLWVAYNQKEMKPVDYMKRNIYFESLPENSIKGIV